MSRTRSLRALLVATTVAGVSLPHLMAGEVAGSWPTLMIGVLVGVGCLRLALVARSQGGRALGAVGITVASLAPLIAYLAQEGAERETGLETVHAEPSLFAAILTQAPLIILALLAMRLLVAVARTLVRAWSHRAAISPARRPACEATPASNALPPRPVASASSNGQRAPPFAWEPYRLAPLG